MSDAWKVDTRRPGVLTRVRRLERGEQAVATLASYRGDRYYLVWREDVTEEEL